MAHTITFDEGIVAVGQEITTQYEGDGAYFADPLVNGFQSGEPVVGENVVDPAACGSGLTLFAPGAGLTESPPYAAEFGDCGALEFPSHGTFGMLTSGVSTLSAYVGEVSASGAFYELDAYDQSHDLIGSTVITAGDTGLLNLISYTAPTGEYIWAFALYTRSQTAVADFGMDNLSYLVPASQLPEISLTTSQLRAGGVVPSSGSLAVTLNRFNGSTGEVDLAVSGLPAGVTASFSPAALTGTETQSTLDWSIGSSASGGTAYQPEVSTLTVSAAPAVPAAGASPAAPVTVTFSVSLAFGWRPDLPAITLADCQTVPYYDSGGDIFALPTSMSGTGTLTVTGGGAGTGLASATLSPTTFSDGSTEPSLTLATGARTPPTDTTLTLTASAPGYATQTATVLVHRIVGEVTWWALSNGGTGAVIEAPHWGTSYQLTIYGSGFCPGTKVAFGEYGNPPSVSSSSPALTTPNYISADGTEMKVTVPHYAANGPIDVFAPGGSFSSSTHFTVGYGYSASDGFNFANRAGPGIGLADLANVFPQSEVYVQVDPCSAFTFGVVHCSLASTGIGTPQADFFLDSGGSAIAKGGECYGFSTSSVYLSGIPGVPIQRSPNSFDPGASNVNQVADNGAIDNYILDNQISQGSSQTQSLDASAKATAASGTAARLESQLRSDLVTPEGYVQPVIVVMYATVNGNFEGHAVVAYDVQGTGNGNFDIFVYNPNDPYGSSDSGDSTNATAAWVANQQGSVIHVQPNGSWSFPELSYKGNLSTGNLYLLPSFSLPTSFDLPGSFSLGNILASTPPSTTLDQVTDAAGHTLLLNGGFNRSATGIPGAKLIFTVTDSQPASPEALLPRGGTYTLTLSPKGGKAVAGGLIGSSSLAFVEGTASGKVTLSLDSRDGTVRFHSGPSAGPFTANIALLGAKGADRTATLGLAGGSTGTITAQLAPAGTLSLRDAGGSAQVTVGLGSSGPDQLPGTFASPPLRVGGSTSIVLHPASWAKLGSSAVTVRTSGRGGKVTAVLLHSALLAGRVTSLHLAVHSSPHVTSFSATADWQSVSAAKGTALGKRFTTASATFLVLQGSRVVADHTVTLSVKMPRLSVTWALKGLPKATYRALVNVVVSTALVSSGSSAASERSATVIFSVR